MIPTRLNIQTRFNALLDDPLKQTFTDAVFTEAFNEAYDAFFNAFLNYQCDRIRIIATTPLSPQTTSLVPSTLYPDFAEPEELEERLLGSTDFFIDLAQWDKLPQRSMADRLLDFVWRFDTYFFVGATTPRELRITYESSGLAPVNDSDSINVDGCTTMLSKYAAGVAGPRKGYDELAERWMQDAVGPKYAQGILGGELWRIIQPRVRERQKVQIAPKPYSTSRRLLIRRTPYIAAQQPAGIGMAPAQFTNLDGTITGNVDGSNTQFFLSYPVTTANVYLNGVMLTSPEQYIFGANLITFVAPFVPQAGATITVQGWV